MPPNPFPGQGRVPLDQCTMFECDGDGCGSKDFKDPGHFNIAYNRLNPREAGLVPVLLLVCAKCGKEIGFDDAGAERLKAHAMKGITVIGGKNGS